MTGAGDGARWWSDSEPTVPWEARDTIRLRRPDLRRPALRLPAPDDPAPDAGRMLGVCAWAALLAVVGLGVAGRAVVALLAGSAPGWYGPAIVFTGLVGIGLTTAAFLAVQHPRLPWGLMAAATGPLCVALASTVAAVG